MHIRANGPALLAGLWLGPKSSITTVVQSEQEQAGMYAASVLVSGKSFRTPCHGLKNTAESPSHFQAAKCIGRALQSHGRQYSLLQILFNPAGAVWSVSHQYITLQA